MADVDPKATYYGGPPRCLLRFRLRAPTVTTLTISVCHRDGYKIRDKSAIPENGIDPEMPWTPGSAHDEAAHAETGAS
jgi:hypothetical protein